MIQSLPPIYGPPNNNSRNAPAAPIKGIDGRLWCPACKGQLHRTRTPASCPECLQALEPAGHVQDADIAAAGVK
jgi:hypothetical protein